MSDTSGTRRFVLTMLKWTLPGLTVLRLHRRALTSILRAPSGLAFGWCWMRCSSQVLPRLDRRRMVGSCHLWTWNLFVVSWLRWCSLVGGTRATGWGSRRSVCMLAPAVRRSALFAATVSRWISWPAEATVPCGLIEAISWVPGSRVFRATTSYAVTMKSMSSLTIWETWIGGRA